MRIYDQLKPDPENKNADELSRNISDSLKLEEEVNFNLIDQLILLLTLLKLSKSEKFRPSMRSGRSWVQLQTCLAMRSWVIRVIIRTSIACSHGLLKPRTGEERVVGRSKILPVWFTGPFTRVVDRPPEKKYLDVEQLDRYLPESFMRSSGQWIFEDEVDEDE